MSDDGLSDMPNPPPAPGESMMPPDMDGGNEGSHGSPMRGGRDRNSGGGGGGGFR